MKNEIGKMESLSDRFVAAVRRVLALPVPLLATVSQKGRGVIAEVKKVSGHQLFVVTQRNRNNLPREIVKILRTSRSGQHTPSPAG
ncbi:MAG TPA: hypothetical protein EYP14_13530 [Planctomycetaceae bacterium]|nr:hypothetical protein [Planctomycetaceae bacterium]